MHCSAVTFHCPQSDVVIEEKSHRMYCKLFPTGFNNGTVV